MKPTQKQEIVRYEFKRNKNITADFIADKYKLDVRWIRTLLNRVQYDYAKHEKKKQGKYFNVAQMQKPEYLEGVDIEADIKHVDVDQLYDDYMSSITSSSTT
jgi:hypothetical protein